MKTFELKAIPKVGAHYAPADFTNILATATAIDYHLVDNIAATPQKRLIENSRVLYYKNDCSDVLPLQVLQSKGLPFESYLLAYTPLIFLEQRRMIRS